MEALRLLSDEVFIEVMDYIKRNEESILVDVYTDLKLDPSLVVSRIKLGLKYELIQKDSARYSVNKKGVEGLLMCKKEALIC